MPRQLQLISFTLSPGNKMAEQSVLAEHILREEFTAKFSYGLE